AGECQVDAAAGGEVLDDRLEEVLQTVGRGDEDADEDAEAFEDRRQRMDSMPGLGCGRLGGGGLLAHGHRPAILARPSPARLSRSRSVSALGSPGIEASVAAEAVWSLTVARPNMRSMGPASTSTNCSRPQGTTVALWNMVPRRVGRSSERSA